MQIKHSFLVATLLMSSYIQAQDYVTTQFMFYNENDETTRIISPSMEVNLDFDSDYTFNSKFSVDSTTGASPIFYDKSYDGSSGASPYRYSTSKRSAFGRGSEVSADEIGYGLVDYYDLRFAGGFDLTKRFEDRDEMRVGFAYSNEYDFRIPEVSFSYLHWLDESKNSSIEGAFAYQKAYVLVWCSENSQCDTNSGASDIFNQYNYEAQITYTRVIDRYSTAKISLFGFRDGGYLSNQYFNVVRNRSGKIFIENELRPNRRKAYGTKFAYARAVTNSLTLHGSYRYYDDDWDINSHTIEGEIYYEYNDRLTFEGAVRYYTQSSAKFYSNERDYFTTQKYASSDRRLGELSDMNYLIGFDYKSSSGINHYFMFNYFNQDNDANAVAVIMGQKYRF